MSGGKCPPRYNLGGVGGFCPFMPLFIVGGGMSRGLMSYTHVTVVVWGGLRYGKVCVCVGGGYIRIG